MNTNKKNTGWILCPSQTFPGKFYYFNVSTGEAAWSLGDAEKKIKKDVVPKVTDNFWHPEPSGTPTDIPSKTISVTPPICQPMKHLTPVFGQASFPKPLPLKPEEPNVIWTPIRIQVPIVFAPDQAAKNTVPKLLNQSQIDIGKGWSGQACEKPLYQRFINYEEPVINFDENNKIKDVQQFDKFFTSTPIKDKEPTKSVQKLQSGTKQLFQSNTNLSFSDLSAKASNQKRLIKQSVFNIELPSKPEKVFSDTTENKGNSLHKIDLFTAKSASQLQQQVAPKSPFSLSQKFDSQFHMDMEFQMPIPSNKVGFTIVKPPKPTDNLVEVTPRPDVNGKTGMSGTNTERCKSFGDDLRTLLKAKRRNTGDKSDSGNIGTVNNVRRQEVPPTPKKKVTFKLDNETIIENDFEYESLYGSHPAVQLLKDLAPARTRKDQWCLVPDADTLLHEFEFLDTFVKSDPGCRLLVPSSVVEEISAVSMGATGVRDLVTRARNVIRRLPNAHIILQSADGFIKVTKAKSIIRCCLEAMDQNIHVILITSDAELISMALSNSIQSFTIREIKYGVAGRQIQNGGPGNEIQDGGPKQNKDTKPLAYKQMKITIQNVPESNEVHSFRKNLFDLDDLNVREREILQKIRNEPQIAKDKSVNNEDSNILNDSTQFSKNTGITFQDISTSYPFSDTISKIGYDTTKLSYDNSSNEKTNHFEMNNLSPNSETPMNLRWKNASDVEVTTIDTSMQSLNLREKKIMSYTNTTPEKTNLGIQNSNETLSVYFQKDSPTFENVNTTKKDPPIASLYFQKEKPSIFEQQETDCAIKNKKQTSSLFEIEHQPIFELKKPEEPQINRFKMGIDTSLFKIVDFKNSRTTLSKKPTTLPSNSSFKIESHSSQTAPKFTFNEFEKQNNFQFKLIESNTSIPPRSHSIFKIDKLHKQNSKFETKKFQKPHITNQPVNGKTDLSRFTVKNETIENRLKERMEEWMCSFRQIMEEYLTGILERLSRSVHKSMVPPWSLYEALQCTKSVYKDHAIVKTLVDQLCTYLYETNFQKDTLKKNINPSDFMKSIGCAMHLFKYLKNILQHHNGIEEAQDFLNNLLVHIEDPSLDDIEVPVKTPVTRLEDEVHKPHFVKHPSEIVNYLIQHYPQWKSWDTCDIGKEKSMNVIRTSGKCINMLKLDKNVFVVSDNAIGEHSDVSTKKLAPNVTENKFVKTTGDKEQTKAINTDIKQTNNDIKATKKVGLSMNFDKITKTIVNDDLKLKPISKNSKGDAAKQTINSNVKTGNILTKIIEYKEKDQMYIGNIATKSNDVESSKNGLINTNYVTQADKTEPRKNNLCTVYKGVDHKATELQTIKSADNVKTDDLTSKEIIINNFKFDTRTLGVKITVPNDYKGLCNRNGDLESEKTNDIDTEFVNAINKVSAEGKINGKNLLNNTKIIRNANLIEEFENKIKSKHYLDSLTSDDDYEERDSHTDLNNSTKKLHNFVEESNYSDKKINHSTEECDSPKESNYFDGELNNYQETPNSNISKKIDIPVTDFNNIFCLENKKLSPNDSLSKNDDINSDKDDLKNSGLENRSSQIFSAVTSFSNELGNSLDAIQQFIDGSMEDYRAGRIRDETKAVFRLKAFEANFLISKIIIRLNKLAHSELIDEKSGPGELSSEKCTIKYMEAVTQCLEQAQTLHRALNYMLAVTNGS